MHPFLLGAGKKQKKKNAAVSKSREPTPLSTKTLALAIEPNIIPTLFTAETMPPPSIEPAKIPTPPSRKVMPPSNISVNDQSETKASLVDTTSSMSPEESKILLKNVQLKQRISDPINQSQVSLSIAIQSSFQGRTQVVFSAYL
jgi:hypothetical protein